MGGTTHPPTNGGRSLGHLARGEVDPQCRPPPATWMGAFGRTMSDVAARMGRMSLAAESGYTAEEVEAVLAVRNALLERGVPRDALQEVPLITVTLVAKCRVEEAVTKFMTYREDLLAAYGVTDVFSPAAETALAEQWHRLAVAGVDEEGRQIMWIHGGGTQPDEEHACIWASTLYFFAVHADLVSLRNGITLVIDTSNAPKKKVS